MKIYNFTKGKMENSIGISKISKGIIFFIGKKYFLQKLELA